MGIYSKAVDFKASLYRSFIRKGTGRFILPSRTISKAISRSNWIEKNDNLLMSFRNINEMSIGKQAGIYAKMRPETAAMYFNTLKNDNTPEQFKAAAKVLDNMKNDAAIKIFNKMDLIVAAKIMQGLIQIHKQFLNTNAFDADKQEHKDSKPIKLLNDERLSAKHAARMLSGIFVDIYAFGCLDAKRQGEILNQDEMSVTWGFYSFKYIREVKKKEVLSYVDRKKIFKMIETEPESLDGVFKRIFDYTPKDLIDNLSEDTLEEIMYKEIIPIELSRLILLMLKSQKRSSLLGRLIEREKRSNTFAEMIKHLDDNSPDPSPLDAFSKN